MSRENFEKKATKIRQGMAHMIDDFRGVLLAEAPLTAVELVDQYLDEEVSDYDIMQCIIEDDLDYYVGRFETWIEDNEE